MKKRPEKSERRPCVSLRYVNVVDGGIHYLLCSLQYVCLKSVARALPANNRENFSSFFAHKSSWAKPTLQDGIILEWAGNQNMVAKKVV